MIPHKYRLNHLSAHQKLWYSPREGEYLQIIWKCHCVYLHQRIPKNAQILQERGFSGVVYFLQCWYTVIWHIETSQPLHFLDTLDIRQVIVWNGQYLKRCHCWYGLQWKDPSTMQIRNSSFLFHHGILQFWFVRVTCNELVEKCICARNRGCTLTNTFILFHNTGGKGGRVLWFKDDWRAHYEATWNWNKSIISDSRFSNILSSGATLCSLITDSDTRMKVAACELLHSL